MVQRWSEMHATHQQSVRMLGTSNHSHKVRKPELLCKCPQHLILVIQRVCRSNRYERGGLSGLAMLSPCQFRALNPTFVWIILHNRKEWIAQ